MRPLMFRALIALPILPLINGFPANMSRDSFLDAGRANAQFSTSVVTYVRADPLMSQQILSAARAGQTEECKWLGVCE
jgi:hypothetical protein